MAEQQPTPARSISPVFEPEDGYTLDSSQATALIAQHPLPVPTAQMVSVIDPALTKISEPEENTSTEEVDMTYVNEIRNAKLTAEEGLQHMKSVASVTTSGAAGTLVSSLNKKRKASELEIDFDDDDDEDDDMDDDEVPPHNPASEQLPKLPIFHPAFELTEKTTKETLQIVEAYIKDSGYKDSEATHLLEEIKRRSRIPYGDAVRIGLIGDAGVGKSSTINSLLGIANLTVEGDDGDSCTYVVIEFRQASPTQLTPFAAEIEFFAREVCHKMIAQLFLQFFQYLEKKRESPNELDDADTENATTARECFQELFAAQPEFKDEEAAEEFLSMAVSETDSRITTKLVKWTNDILNYFVKDQEKTVTLGASTAESLVEQFIPFTRKVHYATYNGYPLPFSPWPLVRLVRVRLDSPILKQGIIIADLPGVSDINRFRVEAANRYMQSCDLTIVVAKIDRPEKSIQFKRQYMDAFRRRRSGSVMMVITRSDDLNLEGKTSIEFSPQDEERLAVIAQTTKDLDALLDETKKAIEKNKNAGKQKANRKLRVKVKKIQERKKALVQERLEVRIGARNKKVSHTLVQNYRLDTRDEARVQIFCISNKAYMHHCRGYEKDDPPSMGLAQTQVPSMRSFVYALPSKGKFATLDHYCGNSVHTLLSMIQMSCSTTTVARKEHLVGIVRETAAELEKQIMALTKKFLETEVAQVVTELTKNDPHSLQSAFIKSARILCRKYDREYGAAAHRAFVRHNGTWKTKKFPQGANWNDAFLSSVRDGLDKLFGRLHDEACSIFKVEIAQVIKEVMTNLNNKLKNDPQALVCNTYQKCFLNNFGRFTDSMAKYVARFEKTLQKEIRAIHVMTVTDGPEHYLTEAMIKIYKECDIRAPTIKGKTLHKSRCEIFESLVCDPEGPFRTVSDVVNENANHAVGLTVCALKRGLKSILVDIKNQFDVMSTEKDNDTPEGQKFRKHLHELADEARAVMEGPVQEALDMCRQYK